MSRSDQIKSGQAGSSHDKDRSSQVRSIQGNTGHVKKKSGQEEVRVK